MNSRLNKKNIFKVNLSANEKRILDERRASMVEEDCIPWEKAKKQLRHKAK